jgi:hypothetical protein
MSTQDMGLLREMEQVVASFSTGTLALGDLAGGSKDVSGAVIVSPKQVKTTEFPKAFQTEHVTTEKTVKPLFVRPVPGGGD